MFAVIQAGGKQYKVHEGDKILVDKRSATAGEIIEFPQVLIWGDGQVVEVGAPTVAGAKVVGKVLGDARGEKVLTVRFRRRKDSRTTRGHRQHYTQVLVTEIIRGSAQASPQPDRT